MYLPALTTILYIQYLVSYSVLIPVFFAIQPLLTFLSFLLVTTCSAVILIVFSLLSRGFNWEIILISSFNNIDTLCFNYCFFVFSEGICKIIFRFATSSIKKRNVLIYGAGELGFVVKRVILSDPKYGFNVKGFIDNDKNLQGKKINGIPVLWNLPCLRKIYPKRRLKA